MIFGDLNGSVKIVVVVEQIQFEVFLLVVEVHPTDLDELIILQLQLWKCTRFW